MCQVVSCIKDRCSRLENTQADSAFRIPVIDFSKSRASDSEKHQTAEKLVAAFKDSGFVYLRNHGIPEKTVTGVFERVRWQLVKSLSYQII